MRIRLIIGFSPLPNFEDGALYSSTVPMMVGSSTSAELIVAMIENMIKELVDRESDPAIEVFIYMDGKLIDIEGNDMVTFLKLLREGDLAICS